MYEILLKSISKYFVIFVSRFCIQNVYVQLVIKRLLDCNVKLTWCKLAMASICPRNKFVLHVAVTCKESEQVSSSEMNTTNLNTFSLLSTLRNKLKLSQVVILIQASYSTLLIICNIFDLHVSWPKSY